MAILIEGISVVIRCRSVVEKLIGGIDRFVQTLPNRTLCSDGDLACLHFMTPNDVHSYIEKLSNQGLTYKGLNGIPVDISVVDQNHGPMIPCKWLQFGHIDWDNDPNKTVSVCFARPTKTAKIVAPEGWTYEHSLTANHQFVDGCSIPDYLKYLRQEDGVDVLQDIRTGKEFFVRRN